MSHLLMLQTRRFANIFWSFRRSTLAHREEDKWFVVGKQARPVWVHLCRGACLCACASIYVVPVLLSGKLDTDFPLVETASFFD